MSSDNSESAFAIAVSFSLRIYGRARLDSVPRVSAMSVFVEPPAFLRPRASGWW
ncbi:hypothetical protein [Williamsia sp. DF01-3]|uniref:hypothetical protein n=1 Tax=Williamsia sp. DF01-3 TaxID=2934157 RepID=UPI001FF651E1|nr:hypothetical protein [Williamsia sp. DF01-3]MCK0517643.1 hypothetical protein [Williamsia sp. DF01-3]